VPVIRARRLRGALPELRPMMGLSAAEALARVLSFGYYLLAARELAPAGFGTLRYTILLATVAFGLLQVLTWTLTRELGAARGDPRAGAAVLGTGLAVAGSLWAASALACVAAAVAGLTGSATAAGLVAVLSGSAVFQVYYGVARGVGEMGRAAGTYIGASAAQVAGFALLVVITDPSPEAAVAVYSLSSVVPVLVQELARPLLFRAGLSADRAALHAIVAIGGPLVAAQVGFLVWFSADQVWVEAQLGGRELGLYAAAKNLAQLFLVLPSGVAGVLIPRLAELQARGAMRRAQHMVAATTAGLLAATALLALVTSLLAAPLLEALYGASYRPAATPFTWLAVGMTAYAGFAALTSAAIGLGRPGVYTAGILLAAGLEVAWLLVVDTARSESAAIAVAGSIGIALSFVAVLLVRRPLGRGTRHPTG